MKIPAYWTLISNTESPSFIIKIYAHRTVHFSNPARKKLNDRARNSFNCILKRCHVVWFTLPHRNWITFWLSNNEVQIQAEAWNEKLDFAIIKSSRERAATSRSFVISPYCFPDWMQQQHTLVISSQSSHFKYASRALACRKMAWNRFRLWLCKKSNLSYQKIATKPTSWSRKTNSFSMFV